MTRPPTAEENARPFDLVLPTADELCAALGANNWVIARRTANNVRHYGKDALFLSPQAFASATAKATAERGWSRPCEVVLRNLIDALESITSSGTGQDWILGVIADGYALLAKARES